MTEESRDNRLAEQRQSLDLRERDIRGIRRYRLLLTPLVIVASGLAVVLSCLQGFAVSYVSNSYPFSVAAIAPAARLAGDKKPWFVIVLVVLSCALAYVLGSILGARAAPVYPVGIKYGVVDGRLLTAAVSGELPRQSG